MQTQLPKTREAIDTIFPELTGVRGERASLFIEAGLMRSPEGYVEFDQGIHELSDIEDFSLEEDLTGEEQVRINFRELPLDVNIALDGTSRQEHDPLTSAKQKVAGQLAEFLQDILDREKDESYRHLVVEAGSKSEKDYITDKVAYVKGRSEVQGKFIGVAHEVGIPFIVSDFSKVSMAQGSLPPAIAVKVNHVLEREVPANVGILNLGGNVELNTNNSGQLMAYNRTLDRIHQSKLQQLRAAGANVVAVVADPRLAHGFDIASSDQQIAKSVKQLQA
jgi:hypothetical protein